MAYWLMKSEPFVYSWDQLVKDKKNAWDGVRNHTAKQNMQKMQIGDEAFFYHSNGGHGDRGRDEGDRLAHPDPSDETGKFVMVGVAPVAPMPKPVTLRPSRPSLNWPRWRWSSSRASPFSQLQLPSGSLFARWALTARS